MRDVEFIIGSKLMTDTEKVEKIKFYIRHCLACFLVKAGITSTAEDVKILDAVEKSFE